MRRIARGEPSRLPHRYERHLLVAAGYGSLEEVDELAAADYLEALGMIPLTLGRRS